LSPKLVGCSHPLDWVKQNAKILPAGFDCLELDGSWESKLPFKMKHIRNLTASVDAWEWLISNGFSSLVEMPSKSENLLNAINQFVCNVRSDVCQAQEISEKDLSAYASEKSQCIYAILKLVTACVEVQVEYSPNIDDLFSVNLQRAMFVVLLVPKDLGLDIISDPLVVVEIPRQSERLFRAISKFAELTSGTRQAASDVIAEIPSTQLRPFDFDKSTLDLFQMLRMFSGYRILAAEGILDNLGAEAKALLKGLSAMRSTNFSPAKKEAAESILKFSLQVLGCGGDPISVWSEIFADIKGHNWRDCDSWKFYERFRQSFDEYLVGKFLTSTKQRDIIFRKSMKSDFGVIILGNLLEFAFKDFILNCSKSANADMPCAVAEQKKKAVDLVKVYLENFDFIERMISSGEGGHLFRKQQVLEMMGRMVCLAPELVFDASIGPPRFCSAYIAILQYFRPSSDSSTLDASNFQLFLLALKLLPGSGVSLSYHKSMLH
jgi:hypothetical protein